MARNKWLQLPEKASAESQADRLLDRGPAATADLFLPHRDRLTHVDDPMSPDVSALAVTGRSIFCTCDETATIEGVTFDPKTGDDGLDDMEDIDRDVIRGAGHAEGIAPIDVDPGRPAAPKRRAAGGKGRASPT